MEKKGIMRLVIVIDKISSWGNLISSWGLFVLMGMGIVSVGLRWAGFPLSGAINLSIYLLVAVIYLSLAYTQLREQHVAVDLIVSRLQGKPRRIIIITAVFLSMVACLFMVWSSWGFAWMSWVARERMDGAPFYPIYPSKIALAVGVSILCMQLAADFIRVVSKYRHVKTN